MRRTALLALLITAAPLTAQAAEMPHRKAGLWTLKTELSGHKMPAGSETKLCVDAATDAAYQRYSDGAVQCSKRDITQSGNQTIIDSVCTVGTRTSTSHGVITWTGDTAYHMDSTTHWSPPLYGKIESHTTQDAKWLGSCPATMKPGDLTMPGGVTINVTKMPAMPGHP